MSMRRSPHHESIEPTRLHTEHGEPYGILDRNEMLIEARLRGIDDVDLLREYIRVEADHKSRKHIMALIQDRIDSLDADEGGGE